MKGRRSTSERIISNDRLPAPITIEARNSRTAPRLAQNAPHFLPAAKVRRQVVVFAAKAAKVDDAAETGGAGGSGKVRGALPVGFFERSLGAH